MQSVHEPVLLHEVLEHLVIRNDKEKKESTKISISSDAPFPFYLDGTLGGAGHALAIVKAYDGKLNIIGLDRDEDAIKRAKEIFAVQKKSLINDSVKSVVASKTVIAGAIILECESFRNLDKVLKSHNVPGVDLILLDLGISSDELDNSGRGFTFQKDEPLLMTMGDPEKYPFTARDILNEWDENVIADIIFGYGEERFARRIARAVVNYRAKKKIETSGEFAEIIKSSVPVFYRRGKIHPATKTFQALRIAVNDELKALKEGLEKGYASLNEGGKMAVISFHSLEDRIVKDFYKGQSKNGANIITKKPIVPIDQEIAENPRSRSAKLRVIVKGSKQELEK